MSCNENEDITDSCEACSRDMDAGEPHTAECESALEQDEEDGAV